MKKRLITIAETAEFQKFSDRYLGVESRDALIFMLAGTPEAGDVIKGTGGVRKLRWARKGKGKSGGYRVIYYYHSSGMPVYLLTGFAKNRKVNLTRAERNSLAKLTATLRTFYGV